MLTIRAPVVGENVAIEPTSRTLITLSIVVPTVAVAHSVCTLTCAVPAVASISTRLPSMRSAWAIPKRSVDRKAERKQLVEQAKALRREGTADAAAAPAPPDDAPMAEKPTFAYAVDAKKARKAAKRRAKVRAREARYDGDVQKTP